MTFTSRKEQTTPLAHDALLTPRSVRFSQAAPRCPPSDYETDPILRHYTKTTRWLGRHIPLSSQNRFRDGGGFRWLADTMVTHMGIPLGAVTCPSAARDFLKMSKNFRQLRYGDHESQTIDVFLPGDENPNHPTTTPASRARGMVFFVHGGAWGSGKPWFYRLVTKPFLEAGLAVAIVGYRVYPLCGALGSDEDSRGGVRTQVDDLEAAFSTLRREYPDWCEKNIEDRLVGSTSHTHQHQQANTTKIPHHLPHLGTIVVGHSSGAHIAMLWLVERVQVSALRQGQSNLTNKSGTIDAFVGVSGVYNIGNHFDYEGARGVEEISPLKPANGYNRKNFAKNSPPWKVQNELVRTLDEMNEGSRARLLSKMPLCFPGRILLVHGAEDDVVPISGTGEAASILKKCLGGGSSHSNDCDITIDEFYLPKTGHQDTIMDLFMLVGPKGPVTKKVIEWILESNRKLEARKLMHSKL